MAQFTVDSFIVELGFNENVIKGLQRVEKLAMQSAQRIERNLNKAFKVNPKSMDKDLTASLGNMEKKINQTFNRLESRAKSSKAFRFKTQLEETVKAARQPRISGSRAIAAAHSANMSKLREFNPMMEKYIQSKYYSLAVRSKSMGSEKFNIELAKLNQNLRETLAKYKQPVKSTSKNNHSGNASNGLDVLATNAIKAGTAIYTFQSALAAYQRVMEVGLQRASSERSIDFVFGKDAGQVKQFIQDLTQVTGMDTTETQAQFASFGASAKNTMGLEGSEELFKNLTGYARLMGRSDEEIKRALTALSQMASKGQVMSEELKGQLAEALPGATQAFAKALGLTEKQLFDKMKNGDVKASDALPKFAKELGSQINSRGGWKAIQDSTQTMLGNLKNTWNNSLTDIFKGSEDGLQDFTRSLTNLLNSLGGSGKTLGESLGSLMTDMSHGVDSLTDISYRVRAFFDEVTLAYRGLTDEQKKVVDALGSGLINSLKILAGVIAVNKVIGVTRSIYGLMTAITRLGQVANTTADTVNKKNGKPSRLNPMNMLLAGSAIYAGYERLASTPERMEAQAKLPELAKESGLKPVFTMDDVKGWFSSAANKVANLQEPMNNFVNNTQTTPPAITGDMVNSNAQLAMAVSELGRKVDALTVETKKPIPVNITGEATIKPDEPAFFRFTQSANDQFTADMLMSSSYPLDD